MLICSWMNPPNSIHMIYSHTGEIRGEIFFDARCGALHGRPATSATQLKSRASYVVGPHNLWPIGYRRRQCQLAHRCAWSHLLPATTFCFSLDDADPHHCSSAQSRGENGSRRIWGSICLVTCDLWRDTNSSWVWLDWTVHPKYGDIDRGLTSLFEQYLSPRVFIFMAILVTFNTRILYLFCYMTQCVIRFELLL